jgi:hypothetical protein
MFLPVIHFFSVHTVKFVKTRLGMSSKAKASTQTESSTITEELDRETEYLSRLIRAIGVSDKAWEIMSSGREYDRLKPSEKSLITRTLTRLRKGSVIQ